MFLETNNKSVWLVVGVYYDRCVPGDRGNWVKSGQLTGRFVLP